MNSAVGLKSPTKIRRPGLSINNKKSKTVHLETEELAYKGNITSNQEVKQEEEDSSVETKSSNEKPGVSGSFGCGGGSDCEGVGGDVVGYRQEKKLDAATSPPKRLVVSSDNMEDMARAKCSKCNREGYVYEIKRHVYFTKVSQINNFNRQFP